MNTLQLQDAFAPYYSEEPNVTETKTRAFSESSRRDMAVKSGDMRVRLKDVRDRLAKAIARPTS